VGVDEVSNGAQQLIEQLTSTSPESSPSKGMSPQVAPDYWSTERDSAHVWSALSQLRQETGELKAAIGGSNESAKEVRADLRELSRDLQTLKAEVQSNLSFVKGAVWVAGILLALVTGVFVYAWGSVIQPGLAHAIVEQLRPEISKQVNEAVKSPAKPAQKQ